MVEDQPRRGGKLARDGRRGRVQGLQAELPAGQHRGGQLSRPEVIQHQQHLIARLVAKLHQPISQRIRVGIEFLEGPGDAWLDEVEGCLPVGYWPS